MVQRLPLATSWRAEPRGEGGSRHLHCIRVPRLPCENTRAEESMRCRGWSRTRVKLSLGLFRMRVLSLGQVLSNHWDLLWSPDSTISWLCDLGKVLPLL